MKIIKTDDKEVGYKYMAYSNEGRGSVMVYGNSIKEVTKNFNVATEQLNMFILILDITDPIRLN